MTGVPDGAAVEVVDVDGQHRGTAAVTDGACEVLLQFRGYRTPLEVPTITPGGSLTVRGVDGSVLTQRSFDFTDLTGVPVCGQGPLQRRSTGRQPA